MNDSFHDGANLQELATSSRKMFVLGDEQERALQQACQAALTATAAELRSGDSGAAAVSADRNSCDRLGRRAASDR